MPGAAGVVSYLTGAASLQNCVVGAGALHEAPTSFPRCSRAGGELRAETRLTTTAGDFQDVSLEIKTSYPERHGARFSPLR